MRHRVLVGLTAAAGPVHNSLFASHSLSVSGIMDCGENAGNDQRLWCDQKHCVQMACKTQLYSNTYK